jgi:hypothetical protein
MQISFDMLSLSCLKLKPQATVETDQSGKPERIGDNEGMAAGTKMLFGGDGSRSFRLPGGGPLEKPIVLLGTSGRKKFVTTAAGFAGGAVSHLCALIPKSCPAR